MTATVSEIKMSKGVHSCPRPRQHWKHMGRDPRRAREAVSSKQWGLTSFPATADSLSTDWIHTSFAEHSYGRPASDSGVRPPRVRPAEARPAVSGRHPLSRAGLTRSAVAAGHGHGHGLEGGMKEDADISSSREKAVKTIGASLLPIKIAAPRAGRRSPPRHRGRASAANIWPAAVLTARSERRQRQRRRRAQRALTM